ncbi:MAG: pyridoxal-phosphate dependent enzyme [Bacteroidota bacterium]
MVSLPTPLQQISEPFIEELGVKVFVKRDDLIHPEIMGNKFRKLKYNLLRAKEKRAEELVTFGGAYSNHIAATAAAAAENGFRSVGYIRGDELNENSNPTLQFAKSKGMDLHFISRSHYRSLCENLSQISKAHPNAYILPEGGTNNLAIKGCAEIIEEIPLKFNYIMTAIGTGGTFCGLVNGLTKGQKAIGISTLKGSFIKTEVEKMLKQVKIEGDVFEINTDYHHGGYGKVSDSLIEFINDFKRNHSIALDPIYTGKTFFAVWDMLRKGYFSKGETLIVLHSGGLQGIEGFNRKSGHVLE